jgi:hypothetical protein
VPRDLVRSVEAVSDWEEIAMRKLLLLGAVGVGLVGAAPVEAMEPVRHFPNQKTAPGFYKGKTLRYLDLGVVRLAPGTRWRRSGP